MTPPLQPPAVRLRLEWLMLAGVVLGVLTAPRLWLPAVPAAIGMAAVWRRPEWRRRVGALLLAVLAGWGGVWWARRPSVDSVDRLLECGSREVTAAVRVTDAALAPTSGVPPPALLRAEVCGMAPAGEPLRPASGVVLLKLPEESAGRTGYGAEFRLDGILRRPEEGAVRVAPDGRGLGAAETDGGFAAYLRRRGIAGVLYADSIREKRSSPGWFGRLLEVRDRLMEAALGGIRDDTCRNRAAALFFGCRGGLEAAGRQQMIRSGTIHIFSVSGLHVGMLALVLFWGLRPLGFRRSHLLVPVLLLGYVATTGAQVPAMRAWWMVAVWCGLRVWLFRTPPEHLLALLAAGFIALNPGNLTDVGFLYSFGITMTLIVLAQNRRELTAVAADPAPMMADAPLRRRLIRRLRRRNRLAAAVAGCAAAFLAGAVVSLHFQGMLLPGAIPANILLLPVVGLLFQLLVGKLAVGWLIPPLDAVLGRWMEWLLIGMDAVTRETADWFGSTAGIAPPWWSVLIFYAALAAVIWPGMKARWRLAGCGLLVLTVLAWHRLLPCDRPAVLICRGGGLEFPAVAFADPAAGRGMAVNVPYGTAEVLGDFFRRHGIAAVDRVAFTVPRSGAASGLNGLLREMPVRAVELPRRERGDHALVRRLRELAEQPSAPGFVELPAGSLRIVAEKSVRRIAYCNSGSKFTATVEWRDAPAPELTVAGGGRTFRRELWNSSVMEICEYEF